jgi:Leucine-rich repeat (LRR) protein
MRGWICGVAIGLAMIIASSDWICAQELHPDGEIYLRLKLLHWKGQLLPRVRADSDLFEAKDLSLWYLTNEQSPELLKFRQLKRLSIWATYVDGDGLRSIGQMKSLESLSLGSCESSRANPFQEWFRIFPPFQQNDARCNIRFGDNDCQQLSQLKALRSLIIVNQSLNGSGLVHLSSLENLTALGLVATDIGDEHAAKLATLQQLESLNLEHNLLTGKTLPKMERLKDLAFSNCPISREFAAQPDRFPSLKTLLLHDIEGLDEWLVDLAQFQTVKTLHISEKDVSAESIAKLQAARPDLVIDVWREPKATPWGNYK